MKNFCLVAFLCVCCILPVSANAQGSTGQTVITVKISGLNCGSCARSLGDNFQELPETDSAQIDMATGTLTITLKPDQDIEDNIIRRLIETPGYKVEKITRSQTTAHPRQESLVPSSE